MRVRHRGAELDRGLAAIRAEQDLAEAFPAEVEAAAARAAAQPRLPEEDRTDLPLVTIDPPGSMDLDQALHVERATGGYRVHYAIADVGAFVRPGDPIDSEARRRGESCYGADTKIPLHPTALSEAAASLLPGEVRPAFLWTVELDADGEARAGRVERALVRSRRRLDYEQAQREVDSGPADSPLAAFAEVGRLRIEREQARGGVSLPMPEQQVDCSQTPWTLEFRAVIPAESWNAQISLLTGFAAAQIMLDGGVGILRTLPPPAPGAVDRLRRTARGLGVAWPAEVDYPAFVRGLDPDDPAHLAMATAATSLLRGAGYAAFDGAAPEQPLHAALAAPYAHVTAPLRRLVDRFGLEVCAALCAGADVDPGIRGSLAELPDLMAASGRRARSYESAVLNLVEAWSLAPRIGEVFPRGRGGGRARRSAQGRRGDPEPGGDRRGPRRRRTAGRGGDRAAAARGRSAGAQSPVRGARLRPRAAQSSRVTRTSTNIEEAPSPVKMPDSGRTSP